MCDSKSYHETEDRETSDLRLLCQGEALSDSNWLEDKSSKKMEFYGWLVNRNPPGNHLLEIYNFGYSFHNFGYFCDFELPDLMICQKIHLVT